MNYEQSITKLDEIIGALSSGNVPLEDSLKFFAEGALIIEKCNKELSQAKLKMEKIMIEQSEE